MNHNFQRFQDLMTSFLGNPKNNITNGGQLQYPCPRCVEEKGKNEITKYNLEVNLFKGFHCWSCCSIDEEMRGSISKLIKLYGNSSILKEYKELITEMRNEPLYKLHFKNTFEPLLKEETRLPKNFQPFIKGKYAPKKALDYLFSRGIDWNIIEKFNMGFTSYDPDNKMVSSRIILPSYDEYGELNYWTGRDYTGIKGRQKYYNPKVERKDLIFNEDKIQWDADITLVEGPFDHIVTPNSIPLLGKQLDRNYKIYKNIYQKANASINIFLDGDAYPSALKIYNLLNYGRLKNKIKYVPISGTEDPSEIYKVTGNKGLIQYLSNAQKLPEFESFKVLI